MTRKEEEAKFTLGERLCSSYNDVIQAPLQPLMDNLESSTYEVSHWVKELYSVFLCVSVCMCVCMFMYVWLWLCMCVCIAYMNKYMPTFHPHNTTSLYHFITRCSSKTLSNITVTSRPSHSPYNTPNPCYPHKQPRRTWTLLLVLLWSWWWVLVEVLWCRLRSQLRALLISLSECLLWKKTRMRWLRCAIGASLSHGAMSVSNISALD
jgi:hypothetical protein